MSKVNAEVLIHSGMHQFHHGRIESIDTSTEIPFAHVALRGSKGQILTTRGAYVPLKYCAEIDKETCDAVAAARKAAMKARRAAGGIAQITPTVDAPEAELCWD